ncbi:MAG: efflux RND transporter periplasmic adaptor subunit, partial [Desulfobulbaceae bacterium]|nr:efflux RND transporter periplasmic adaptor subunit [Desulfobulbaceae bacterium]
ESEVILAKARAEAARQQAEIASREAERLLRLQKSGAVSEQETDTRITEAKIRQADYSAAQAAAKSSSARLGVLRAELERTRLIAPFSGIIAEINGELNEFVTPSPPGIATPPTVVLLDTTSFYVTAPIDEVDAPEIKVGMPARIILDAYGERHFAGTVRRISPYVLDVEKQARTVDIEVRFNEPPKDIFLLAGYSADVEVIIAVSQNTIRIPTQAILDGSKVYVYSPEDRKIHSRTITTGLTNWEQTEITDGLKEGEQILTSIDREGVADNATISVSEGP